MTPLPPMTDELRTKLEEAGSVDAARRILQEEAARYAHTSMHAEYGDNRPSKIVTSDAAEEPCDPVASSLDLALAADAERMLRFFRYAHLKPPLALVSREFARLALTIVEQLPASPERTVALRKLLEAKDCGVRAALDD